MALKLCLLFRYHFIFSSDRFSILLLPGIIPAWLGSLTDTHACTHWHAQTHPHVQTHPHTQTHPTTQSQSHTPTQRQAGKQAGTCTHSDARTHTNTETHRRAGTNAHIRINTLAPKGTASLTGPASSPRQSHPWFPSPRCSVRPAVETVVGVKLQASTETSSSKVASDSRHCH